MRNWRSLNSDVSKGQGEACGGRQTSTPVAQGLAWVAHMGDTDVTAAHIFARTSRSFFSSYPKKQT